MRRPRIGRRLGRRLRLRPVSRQRFFFRPRLEGQQTQQHHGQGRIFVRRQAELGTAYHTASRAIQEARDRRQLQAERTVAEDPFVQKMMREFNAVIVPGSVKPLTNSPPQI